MTNYLISLKPLQSQYITNTSPISLWQNTSQKVVISCLIALIDIPPYHSPYNPQQKKINQDLGLGLSFFVAGSGIEPESGGYAYHYSFRYSTNVHLWSGLYLHLSTMVGKMLAI